ncbi:hypothetical protein J2S43_002679 [Catenuloplanes nepalensis]|uniref:OmpR/PhoB-type domain-containing protein n=1 Tax=Catenuloplanes nepalensis TaxID=587533 RepID=A0ABT9MRU8_9ACTN|nr:response regulator transcription factor [Catenuloplanes nepalensis]MDP9794167.1 hypothetical protein [Catenuloplanes nepalensis]
MTWCESLVDLVPEIGAEVADYVTKPYQAAELLARVEVLLRARDAARDPVLRHGDLLLDEVTCQAWRGDRPLDVTAAEYRLLRYLLHNAGRVLSKDQLAWQVWGEARGSNAIERLMSRLRQARAEVRPASDAERRGDLQPPVNGEGRWVRQIGADHVRPRTEGSGVCSRVDRIDERRDTGLRTVIL